MYGHIDEINCSIWAGWFFDVRNSYLNISIDFEIYVGRPKDFVISGKSE